MTALQPGNCRCIWKIFCIMLTATANDPGEGAESSRRARKSGSGLAEKPVFVEVLRSMTQ
jgi:hypothetical protein